MIEVLFSPQCAEVMRILEISPDQVVATINERHYGLVSDGLDRIIAARWIDAERILFVDSIVTEKEIDEKLDRVRFDQVTAQIAIKLYADLPAGSIDPGMSMEEILTVIADSFGFPVTCHPEQTPAAVYAGPWDGQQVMVNIAGSRSTVYICGSFYPDSLTCELVWALDFEQYWKWSLQPDLQLAQLTFNNLIAIAKSFTWQFPSVQPTSEAIQYSLAATVLRAFVGDSWCDEQLPGTLDAHPRFQQADANSLPRMKAQAWTVALAEMVFNLQEIPGFGSRLRRLPLVDLESAVAELEGARLLALSDLPIKFVDESAQQGAIYDVEVDLPAGGPTCCEMKCKMEKTLLRKEAIEKSLKKAAHRQLPSSSPGIVFLKIPEDWVAEPRIGEIVDSAVHHFFQNYKRVIAAIVFWEEWHQLQNGPLLRLAKFREMTNYKSRFHDPKNVGLLKSYDQIATSRQWRTFADVVAALDQ